jgi:hypothetical protein
MVDAEKVAAMKARAAAHSKGAPRRAVKKAAPVAAAAGTGARAVQSALQKIGCQTIPDIQEVQFFQADNTVLQFQAPTFSGNPNANCFAVAGPCEQKPVDQFIPDLFSSQFSPEQLKKLEELARQAQDAPTDFSA